MKTIIDVNTGEVKAAKGPAMLRSVAVGSCIVVAALNYKRKISAMTHIMLQDYVSIQSSEKTKYEVETIERLINDLN